MKEVSGKDHVCVRVRACMRACVCVYARARPWRVEVPGPGTCAIAVTPPDS